MNMGKMSTVLQPGNSAGKILSYVQYFKSLCLFLLKPDSKEPPGLVAKSSGSRAYKYVEFKLSMPDCEKSREIKKLILIT